MFKCDFSINWEVVQSFKKFKDSDFKEECTECKFCDFKCVWQFTDLQRHLNNCSSYLDQQDALESTQLKQRQMRLIVPIIGLHMLQNLKLSFAKAVVMDDLSLNVFESKKELNQAIKLLNNKFQLPTAQEICEKLLSDKFCFYLLYIIIYLLFL